MFTYVVGTYVIVHVHNNIIIYEFAGLNRF